MTFPMCSMMSVVSPAEADAEAIVMTIETVTPHRLAARLNILPILLERCATVTTIEMAFCLGAPMSPGHHRRNRRRLEER